MGSSLLIINRILGHSRLTIRTLVDNRSAANRALPDHSPLAIKTIMGSSPLAGSLHLVTNKILAASPSVVNRALVGSLHLVTNKIMMGNPLATSRDLAANHRLIASRVMVDNRRLIVNRVMVGNHRLAINKTSVASKASTSLADLTINRVLETRITMVVCRGMGIRVNPLSHLQTRSQILSRSVPGRFKTSSQGHRRTLASVGKEALNRIKVNHSLVKTRPRFQIMGSLVSS